MKKKLNCILLVDDNEADNNFHRIMIEEAQIAEHIDVEENGVDALAYLQREGQVPPDLIFLDINMPKMNGWEFLDEYKKVKADSRSKVIVMLTTSQNPEDREKAAGISEVNGFQVKPISVEGLKKIVNKYFPDTAL